MKSRSNLYTLLFAAALSVVCATILTGAKVITGPYRDANVQADRVRNILEVLHVPFDHTSAARQLVEVFNRNIRQREIGELTCYAYVPPGQDSPQAIAVPLNGPGVWGPMHGFLALAPDMQTVRAITFYAHEETPGLGGEISNAPFRGQFEGRSIIGPNGPGMKIVRGGAKAPNEVDAISGATMTCDKVQLMLNRTIKQLAQEQH